MKNILRCLLKLLPSILNVNRLSLDRQARVNRIHPDQAELRIVSLRKHAYSNILKILPLKK